MGFLFPKFGNFGFPFPNLGFLLPNLGNFGISFPMLRDLGFPLPKLGGFWGIWDFPPRVKESGDPPSETAGNLGFLSKIWGGFGIFFPNLGGIWDFSPKFGISLPNLGGIWDFSLNFGISLLNLGGMWDFPLKFGISPKFGISLHNLGEIWDFSLKFGISLPNLGVIRDFSPKFGGDLGFLSQGLWGFGVFFFPKFGGIWDFPSNTGRVFWGQILGNFTPPPPFHPEPKLKSTITLHLLQNKHQQLKIYTISHRSL